MSSKPPPTVSVIIPCYNLGAYLDEAVESVLTQTYQDFEVVIVNDGSTDPDTNRLLLNYRRPKTRVVQSENRGLSAARNLAIAHSLGRYLCALDADDRLAPNFLDRTLSMLEQDAGLAFASCWLETFGTEQWVWKQDRCDLSTLLGECTVATPSLVRSAVVREVGGYDERMQGYEDWDLWITLVERGYRGTILPEVLFYYRRRPGSMSETCCHGEAHLKLMQYLISKHEASYRMHLVDVLVSREAVGCDVLRETYAIDREINSQLVPTIEVRKQELARLHQRLEAIDARKQSATCPSELARVEPPDREKEELRVALGHCQAELSMLRNSRSWRLTAPLRSGIELLRRLRGESEATGGSH